MFTHVFRKSAHIFYNYSLRSYQSLVAFLLNAVCVLAKHSLVSLWCISITWAKVQHRHCGLRILCWLFLHRAVILGHGHLSKSKTDCQNPPLYNKYFIFIYSEQWPRSRNRKWPNDLDQMTTNFASKKWTEFCELFRQNCNVWESRLRCVFYYNILQTRRVWWPKSTSLVTKVVDFGFQDSKN